MSRDVDLVAQKAAACFKAYDIRGQVPETLDADVAYAVGRAYVDEIGAKKVVVGYDVRLESPLLAEALSRGLCDAGADVINIGLCGTEEVYFQTFYREGDGVGGGIMVTASHNPKGYNGMKLVREGARPVSGDTGLFAIRDRVIAGTFRTPERSGDVILDYDKAAYIRQLLSCVEVSRLKPLTLVVDPGNGGAGPVMRLLERYLPFTVHYVHECPDGNFPNGVPNPLLPEMRSTTANAVVEHGADLGIAWDGDFDRCFLFDANGRFIEGYYLVGLLAETLLDKHPREKIIHDPRLTWNTIDQVRQAGGTPVQCKTGHAFIKQRMREEDAIYGGEMSAHHYFRDFAYCDSGMIPWLLITELMSETEKTLAQLVDERMLAYPCSGELNYQVDDVPASIDRVFTHFVPMDPVIDRTDGLSVEFPDWRFNLRGSNTEPLLRLNVEVRATNGCSDETVQQHVATLERLLDL
ncbi:phosphomannomutase [Halothiobacillus sp.]|uniref:phosphomannomutase n=1 Tax=Halothiobacillus sp. TaxID=1891311 RepID=UPI002AD4B3F1|nr:phosphomannomutase [Halothiobacillus sp.]